MSQTPATRPDVLLIHCHDLGDWLSCYGRQGVPDPHISAFADRSVVFERVFATAPLCTPARSSMFTGRLPHQNGLMGLTHHGWEYRPDVVTLPEMMSDHGYRTALVGLQHEELDARRLGYDEVIGLGMLPRALPVVEVAEGWLASTADAEAPRFAVVGFWEVHRPWPHEDYMPADPAEVEVPPFLPDNEHTRRDVADFLGSIRQLDTAISRLLEALDATERGRETLVIFTTDHGAAFPRAKSTLYDQGVKVAFVVRPPASWEGAPRRVTEMVSHLDIAPTLVALAGGTTEALDGIDLLPMLQGEGGRGHDALVFEKTYHDQYDPIRAIRTAGAKYIRNFVEGPRLPLSADLEQSVSRRGLGDDYLKPRPPEELYLLGRDPWELENVAGRPEAEELKERLSRRLHDEMVRTSDPLVIGDVAAPPQPERGGRGSAGAL